jgi:hypothetical protein
LQLNPASMESRYAGSATEVLCALHLLLSSDSEIQYLVLPEVISLKNFFRLLVISSRSPASSHSKRQQPNNVLVIWPPGVEEKNSLANGDMYNAVMQQYQHEVWCKYMVCGLEPVPEFSCPGFFLSSSQSISGSLATTTPIELVRFSNGHFIHFAAFHLFLKITSLNGKGTWK